MVILHPSFSKKARLHVSKGWPGPQFPQTERWVLGSSMSSSKGSGPSALWKREVMNEAMGVAGSLWSNS